MKNCPAKTNFPAKGCPDYRSSPVMLDQNFVGLVVKSDSCTIEHREGKTTRRAPAFPEIPLNVAHSACETSQNVQKTYRLQTFFRFRLSRLSKFDGTVYLHYKRSPYKGMIFLSDILGRRRPVDLKSTERESYPIRGETLKVTCQLRDRPLIGGYTVHIYLSQFSFCWDLSCATSQATSIISLQGIWSLRTICSILRFVFLKSHLIAFPNIFDFEVYCG
jgi:hypothetical protein